MWCLLRQEVDSGQLERLSTGLKTQLPTTHTFELSALLGYWYARASFTLASLDVGIFNGEKKKSGW